MTSQRLLESRQQGDPLRAQRRKVAANTAKPGEAQVRPKAAGNRLLDLHHPQIALGLVIAERTSKVNQKGQHLPRVERKPIQQMACRALFFPSPAPRSGWRVGRIGLIALVQQVLIASVKPPQSQDIQFPFPGGFRSLDGGFHVQQKRFHVRSPLWLEFFF